MLSDLRESGAIEQDADIVMFIYRPEYYGIKEDNDGSTIGMADIILAKHRSGGTGRVRLRFQGQYARFTNPEFLTNEQVNNNMLPQNTGFDESGAPTMLIDSKINRKNDGLDFATGLPNDEPPF
jgi:replicative DNA helicase